MTFEMTIKAEVENQPVDVKLKSEFTTKELLELYTNSPEMVKGLLKAMKVANKTINKG